MGLAFFVFWLGFRGQVIAFSFFKEIEVDTMAKVIHFGCACCLHFRGGSKSTYKFYCEAFPDGIPDEIENSLFDHRKPHPNDKGIQFEMNPDKEDQRVYVEEAYKIIEERIRQYNEKKRRREVKLRENYGLDEDVDLEAFMQKQQIISKQRKADALERLKKKRQQKKDAENNQNGE